MSTASSVLNFRWYARVRSIGPFPCTKILIFEKMGQNWSGMLDFPTKRVYYMSAREFRISLALAPFIHITPPPLTSECRAFFMFCRKLLLNKIFIRKHGMDSWFVVRGSSFGSRTFPRFRSASSRQQADTRHLTPKPVPA